MSDRVVVLRTDDGISFVADACAALADAVNELRVVRTPDTDLVDAYAELVVAYSRLVRRQLADDPTGVVRVNIIDHLLERLRQARAGEDTLPIVDLVDRLHGELTREPAGV
jgi:hypothetical protein